MCFKLYLLKLLILSLNVIGTILAVIYKFLSQISFYIHALDFRSHCSNEFSFFDFVLGKCLIEPIHNQSVLLVLKFLLKFLHVIVNLQNKIRLIQQ